MKTIKKIEQCECETPHSYRNRTSCPGHQANKIAVSAQRRHDRIVRGNQAKIAKAKKTLIDKKVLELREWQRKCRRLLFLQARLRRFVLGCRDNPAPTKKEETLKAFYADTLVHEQECRMTGKVPKADTAALTSSFIDYLVYVFGEPIFKKKNGLPTLPPLGAKIKSGKVPPPKRVRFNDTP
jgi:hypothetical protein